MRECGTGIDDVVRRIKRSLLGDTLGEDGGLGDVKFKSSILLQDVLELRQDLHRHTQPSFDVTIISISKRLGHQELCENTSP